MYRYIQIVLLIILSCDTVKSVILSDGHGLMSYENGIKERLANNKVNTSFEMCGDTVYWQDSTHIFKGSINSTESEVIFNFTSKDGENIKSFAVDCALGECFILTSSLLRYHIANQQSNSILDNLKNANRMSYDTIYQKLYFLYDDYIECFNIYGQNKQQYDSLQLKPYDSLQLKPTALAVGKDNLFVADTLSQTILKCSLEFKMCIELTNGTGYILNMRMSETNLLVTDIQTNFFYEINMENKQIVNQLKVETVKDAHQSQYKNQAVQGNKHQAVQGNVKWGWILLTCLLGFLIFH
ncbi:hypothetical protein Bpfe_015111 [Biomphalaria pfeifferi]|uniref:Transmembrane protein n=1 Tax=Biomphalaria pfeifferi TaxID=112525 RepID=A0AAD8BJ89_BIOPF|nr:hypothetical protein Bpfe_015111 [Biomphalaria pfeifferi]